METPLSLVIFDCDGVLVDSEATINRVLAREISALGWKLTPAKSQSIFLGLSLSDILPMVEGRTGQKLGSDWPRYISEKTSEALADGVPLMPNALSVLDELSHLGMPWRVASNSSRQELSIKFARTGLDKIVNPAHVHSASDMVAIGKRGKPAPDLFLAAAEAEGVHPDYCLVIEDSAVGARAAAAAGMECLGYAPHNKGMALQAEGARIIRDLSAILPLVRARVLVAA